MTDTNDAVVDNTSEAVLDFPSLVQRGQTNSFNPKMISSCE